MYHDFQWLLVATKLLAASLHSCYVMEPESEILDDQNVSVKKEPQVRSVFTINTVLLDVHKSINKQ